MQRVSRVLQRDLSVYQRLKDIHCHNPRNARVLWRPHNIRSCEASCMLCITIFWVVAHILGRRIYFMMVTLLINK